MSSDESRLDHSLSELVCLQHVTRFASTMPPLTSTLPGQAQDMPPRCLHMSSLLRSSVPVDGQCVGVTIELPESQEEIEYQQRATSPIDSDFAANTTVAQVRQVLEATQDHRNLVWDVLQRNQVMHLDHKQDNQLF